MWKKTNVRPETAPAFRSVSPLCLPQPVHAFDQLRILINAPGGQDIAGQDGKIEDAPQGNGTLLKIGHLQKIHDQQQHRQEDPEIGEPELEFAVVEKKDIQLARKLEFFEMDEGKCVHMMHVGPFSDEPKSLKILGIYMKENDFKKNGLHHEIYLSDFRKTEPSKLKTILREPVK